MIEIKLQFEDENKFNSFRFMLEAGFSELVRFYEKSNQLDQSLGVRKHYAEIWQQIEDQKNVAE